MRVFSKVVAAALRNVLMGRKDAMIFSSVMKSGRMSNDDAIDFLRSYFKGEYKDSAQMMMAMAVRCGYSDDMKGLGQFVVENRIPVF